MQKFMSDKDVVARVLGHIANKTTDRGDEVWEEPVVNYQSPERFEQELMLMQSVPVPFCPSSAIPSARRGANALNCCARQRRCRSRL